MDMACMTIERMAQRAAAVGNRPAADNYRAALVSLAKARHGPWPRYRDALGRLVVARRERLVRCVSRRKE